MSAARRRKLSGALHALPFDTPIDEALHAEYLAQPLGRRVQALRKAGLREAGLWLGGQKRRQVTRVPESTRALLWIYTWTTVGDAVMDLSARRLVPEGVAVDLVVAPALRPLFEHDRRLRSVLSDARAAAPDVDFVLLDAMRSRSLRLKAERFAKLPFATMRGHHTGERFDRVAFADRRMRQLFGLETGPVAPPRLDLGGEASAVATKAGAAPRIAVALGARLPENRYAHWSDVLARILAGWPVPTLPPVFVFIGQGRSARADLGAIEPALVREHGEVAIDRGDLRHIGLELGRCTAFLGVDGGLMHVAVGVGTPGLALFSRILPAWRLHDGDGMRSLRSDEAVSALPPAEVAAAFLRGWPEVVAADVRRRSPRR